MSNIMKRVLDRSLPKDGVRRGFLGSKIGGNFDPSNLQKNMVYIKLSAGPSYSGLTWKCNLDGKKYEDTVDESDGCQREVVDYVNSLYKLCERLDFENTKKKSTEFKAKNVCLILELDENGEKSFFTDKQLLDGHGRIVSGLRERFGLEYKEELIESLNWWKVGLFFRVVFELVADFFDSDRRKERERISDKVDSILKARGTELGGEYLFCAKYKDVEEGRSERAKAAIRARNCEVADMGFYKKHPELVTNPLWYKFCMAEDVVKANALYEKHRDIKNLVDAEEPPRPLLEPESAEHLSFQH